jgi:hypothetical protein
MAHAAGCLRNVLLRVGACGLQMVNWTQRQPGRAVAVARPLVCVSGHVGGSRRIERAWCTAFHASGRVFVVRKGHVWVPSVGRGFALIDRDPSKANGPRQPTAQPASESQM